MRLFDKIRRKRLGVTWRNVQRILVEMEAVEPIDEGPVEVLTLSVMAQLREECKDDAWCEAEKAAFDFEGLFEFLMKLIEMLIPLIVKKRAPIQIFS